MEEGAPGRCSKPVLRQRQRRTCIALGQSSAASRCQPSTMVQGSQAMLRTAACRANAPARACLAPRLSTNGTTVAEHRFSTASATNRAPQRHAAIPYQFPAERRLAHQLSRPLLIHGWVIARRHKHHSQRQLVNGFESHKGKYSRQ